MHGYLIFIVIILSITLIIVLIRQHFLKSRLLQFASMSSADFNKQIEIILRFYRKLVESNNEGLWIAKYRQRIVLNKEPNEIANDIFEYMYFDDCNDYFAELLNLSSKLNVVNKDLRDLPNVSKKYLVNEMESLIREKKYGSISILESPFLGIDKLFVNSIYSLIVDNELIATVGLLRDFTKFTSTEIELFDLKYAIEKTSEGICITDSESVPIYVNKAFSDITGYSFEEIRGKNLDKLLFDPEYGLPESEKRIYKVLSSGGYWTGKALIKTKDGSHKHLIANVTAVEYDNEPNKRFIAVISDVTHEKKLEEALLQSQKLQAMGTLTGGVAHDFNNVLAVILGNTDYLINNIEAVDKEDLIDSLRIIDRSAKQAEAQTRRLLAFSRKTDTRIKSVKLDSWLNEVKPIYDQVIQKKAKLELKLSAGEALCGLDHSLFELAIMNLVKNASQAIEGAGKIEIRTSIKKLNEIEELDRKHFEPGDYALIEVEDNGSGMPEEIMKRIFEPFYTTKEEGKGTGLGLSMVYGIVDEHNGSIFVYSQINKGTLFKIYLPLIESSGDDEDSENQISKVQSSDVVTVLVDDDKNFGNVMTKLFKSKNLDFKYFQTVDECNDFIKSVTTKNLVLVLSIDSTKQENSKPIQDLRTINKKLKCLVIGTCNKSIVVSKIALKCDDTLCKPFNFNMLINKISGILD